jgi:hypothetical protein
MKVRSEKPCKYRFDVQKKSRRRAGSLKKNAFYFFGAAAFAGAGAAAFAGAAAPLTGAVASS